MSPIIAARAIGASAYGFTSSIAPSTTYISSFGTTLGESGGPIVVNSDGSIVVGSQLQNNNRSGLWFIAASKDTTTLSLTSAYRYTPGASTSLLNGESLKKASSGNLYFCGQSSVGNWLLKVNSTGTYQWAKTLSAAGNIARGLGIDSSENVYVSYTDNSTVSIAKWDSSGNLQWHRKLTPATGSLSNSRNGLSVASNGDVYAVVHQTGGNTFIVKYNSSGVLQWQRHFGIGSTTTAYAISVDPNNNTVLISGNTTVSSVATMFTAKYTSSGTYQSSRRFINNSANGADGNQGYDIYWSAMANGTVYYTAPITGNLGIGLFQVDHTNNFYISWQRHFTGVGSGASLGEDSNYQVYLFTSRTNSGRGGDHVIFRLSSDGTKTGSYVHRTTSGAINTTFTSNSTFTSTAATATTQTTGNLTDTAGGGSATTRSDATNYITEPNASGGVVTTLIG